MYLKKKIIDLAIIMPCYNVANLVVEAIESIMDNTYLPKKIILIDDYSTDNTLEIIETSKYKYLDSGVWCQETFNYVVFFGMGIEFKILYQSTMDILTNRNFTIFNER